MNFIPEQVLLLVTEAHRHKKIVVLCTGVFDLFHSEHQKFLDAAKKLGEVLIVAIESDARVKQLKGDHRPIWSQAKRLQAVLHYDGVSRAFILPDDFSSPAQHEALIKAIAPDFFAISSHSPHQEQKKRIVEKYGGKVVIVLAHNPQVSTTQIIESQR